MHKYAYFALAFLLLFSPRLPGEFLSLNGDWMTECISEEKQCNMSQVVKLRESDQIFSKVSMIFDYTNGLKSKLMISLPLGLPLNTKPQLYVDDVFETYLPIRFCLKDGCYFSLPMDPVLLEKFLHMQAANIILNNMDGARYIIPISGKGSRAAFNGIRDRF